ncbi:MAG: PQQ-dependent sugar dehydrogenase, partial [Gemmatimonadales bacterium]
MKRSHLSVGLALSLILAAGASSCGSTGAEGAAGPPAGTVPVGLEEVTAGLDFPLDLTTPPGDVERLFVAEKGGRIRIVKNGSLLPEPFLDISTQVSTGSEQGLLGFTFTPDYGVSGRFVVHYTDLAGDTRLSVFTVSTDPDRADPASEKLILTTPQPFANHNGGQVVFGPDGYLYLGLGDGGSGGDPLGNGQDLTDFLGSLLRLDLSPGTSYAIPPDNPFAGATDARPEVWSHGLRNPWRFSFDRATGDLYIADVGQDRWEEIDVALGSEGGGNGVNYGWSRMEGNHCFGASRCDPTGLALPVLEYSHQHGCSVTGGYVYRGAAIPALQGHYFYADLCQGWVRSFRLQDGHPAEEADWPTLRPGGLISSFGQ